MKYLLLSILFVLPHALANQNQSKLDSLETITKFAFGSCNREWFKQRLWNDIVQDKPELFLWGGDIIYGDKKPNKHNLEKKYQILNDIPGYKKLKETTPVIGVWDDHDYDMNNGDRTNPRKERAKKALLDFLDEPQNSARWNHSGIYTSYTFGPKDKRVKFILLDVRYNLKKKTEILGEEQKNWLESELASSDAKIHFIVSGMPVLPASMFWTEEWSDYPRAKKGLFEILKKHKTPGVIFLTGDKHFGAITQKDNYVEIMSSGMTHLAPKVFRPLLRRRFKNTYFGYNYGLITIDWDSNPIKVKAQIKGRAQEVGAERTLKLNELSFY